MNELTPSAKQYEVGTEMKYSTELSGNWIWQEDSDMDDGMRAVVQIHDGSPLFNANKSWNDAKLTQLAKFLLSLRTREHKTFEFPNWPAVEMTKFPEFGFWITAIKYTSAYGGGEFWCAMFVAINQDGTVDADPYRGEVEDWGEDARFRQVVEDYFGVEFVK